MKNNATANTANKYRWLLAMLAAASLMTGCANKSLKQKEHKPASLVKLVQNQPAVRELWSYRIGGANTKDPLRLEMVNAAGNFFAASRAGELVKLSPTGSKLWSKTLKNSITSGVAANDTMLVVADSKGMVQAFSTDDGAALWQQQLSGTVLAPALVTTKRVVVATNNGLIAGLDSGTGKPVWQFKINMPKFSLRGSAKPIRLSNNFAIVAAADGRVHAFRIDSGLPMWVRRVAVSAGNSDFDRLNDVDADPVFYKFNLYTASFQSHLVGIDMNTRKELFQKKLSTHRSLAVDEQHVYAVNTVGDVLALNRKTGEQVWQQKALAYRKLSNPVVVGKHVFVGDYSGYLHTLDASTGTLLGRSRTEGAINQINLMQNQLLIQTDAGEVSLWQTQ